MRTALEEGTGTAMEDESAAASAEATAAREAVVAEGPAFVDEEEVAVVVGGVVSIVPEDEP